MALAAAACGGSSASPGPRAPATSLKKAALATESPRRLTADALTSLTGSPATELRAAVSHAVLGTATTAVSQLSLSVVASSGSRSLLSTAPTGPAASAEVELSAGTFPLLQVIEATRHLYLRLDLTHLGELGLSLSPAVEQEIAKVEAAFGGRWFELPEQLPAGDSSAGHPSIAQQIETELLGAFSGGRTSRALPAAGGGVLVSVDGNLHSVVVAALPYLDRLFGAIGEPQLPSSAGSIPASYRAVYRLDAGGTLTSATVHLVAQAASADLDVQVTHRPARVAAPAGAVAVPAAEVAGLLAVAGAALGGAGSAGDTTGGGGGTTTAGQPAAG